MDAPKCRICGRSEWRHVCSGAEKKVVANAPKRKPLATKTAANCVANADRHKKTPRRLAYQRDLMRLRRALTAGRAERWPKQL